MSRTCLGSPAAAQQTPPNFHGAYAGLDERRQQLIYEWISRFVKTTGQAVQPGLFYDDIVPLSAKTTFDAVTHALMTTRLTDRDGASLGDALGLVERVEVVRGEVAGARGDGQVPQVRAIEAWRYAVPDDEGLTSSQ